jgi:putative SOS response-associated peptidase YedK
MEQFFSLTRPVAEPYLAADFNVAPSRDAYTIVEQEGRVAKAMRWGLVPSWSKDSTLGNRLINARLETVADKPSFRSAFRKRRCLVVADGFYEWQRLEGGPKQPYFLHPAEQPLMAMAGIFEVPHVPFEDGTFGDDEPFTFSILTTEAISNIAGIHYRMPVLVPPSNWAAWLDPELQEPSDILALVPSPPVGFVEAYPVSREVNDVRHNSADLLAAVKI